MSCFATIAQHLNGARGWRFDYPSADQKVHRAIHLRANHKWYLTTFDDEGNRIRTPMPDGEYTLDFPPGSANLSILVIDPDPGNPGGLD